MKLKAYIASPFGFAESTRYFMEEVYLPELSEVVEIISPWSLTTEEEVVAAAKEGRENQFAMEIGRRNKEAIDSCDIVIAALDGQEVDSGTAAEIGYAVGRGKKVFGYRTDLRQSGVLVNLQVQYFIEVSGGKIFTSLPQLKKALKAA